MQRDPKESISLYDKDRRAYASKKEGGHLTGDYDILKDEVSEDGTRTIVLKPHPLEEHKRNVGELVDLLVERIEPGSKVLRSILLDTLRDFGEESITRMLHKITKKKEKVKVKEGCYKILIGDGRKRSSEEIMLVR